MSRDHPLFLSSPFPEETDSYRCLSLSFFFASFSLSLSFHVSLFTTTMTYSPYLLFRRRTILPEVVALEYNNALDGDRGFPYEIVRFFIFIFYYYFLSLQYQNRLILFFRKKKNYHHVLLPRDITSRCRDDASRIRGEQRNGYVRDYLYYTLMI